VPEILGHLLPHSLNRFVDKVVLTFAPGLTAAPVREALGTTAEIAEIAEFGEKWETTTTFALPYLV
jgi:hypothetical protein